MRGLGHVIEAAGDGRVAEAEIAQQRLDRRRIRAREPPFGAGYSLRRSELGQPRRGVVARIEADGQHVEPVGPDDAPGVGDRR